jgi:hypothetical protein
MDHLLRWVNRMSRETDYKERTIDDAVDVIDNSIVI